MRQQSVKRDRGRNAPVESALLELVRDTHADNGRAVDDSVFIHAVERIVDKHLRHFQIDVDSRRDAEFLYDTEVGRHVVACRSALVPGMSEAYAYIGKNLVHAVLFVAENGCREVHHEVAVQVPHVELLTVKAVAVRHPVDIRAVRVREPVRAGSVHLEPHTDGRSEPFAEVDLESRRDPLAECAPGIVLSLEHLSAGAYSDVPVIEEPVGQVGIFV